MRTVFADSGYWIGLLHPRDQHHARAMAIAEALGDTPIVTTQMVLVETFSHLAGQGQHLRGAVVQIVRELEANSNVEIVPQTDAQFRAAVEMYGSRLDQTWSVVDCASFLVMEQRGITDALAHDRDFEQAGFTALLRGG